MIQKTFHHFGPKNEIHGIEVGTYMKEVRLAAGFQMPMHIHTHAHQSLLAQGNAILTVNGQPRPLIGPCVIDISANDIHSLEAVTPIVWYCIHATDETDPDHIDERLTQ